VKTIERACTPSGIFEPLSCLMPDPIKLHMYALKLLIVLWKHIPQGTTTRSQLRDVGVAALLAVYIGDELHWWRIDYADPNIPEGVQARSIVFTEGKLSCVCPIVSQRYLKNCFNPCCIYNEGACVNCKRVELIGKCPFRLLCVWFLDVLLVLIAFVIFLFLGVLVVFLGVPESSCPSPLHNTWVLEGKGKIPPFSLQKNTSPWGLGKFFLLSPSRPAQSFPL